MVSRAGDEVSPSVVACLAERLRVDVGGFAGSEWLGRTIEYRRAQVRVAFGLRELACGDEDRLAGWLAEEVCLVELRDE